MKTVKFVLCSHSGDYVSNAGITFTSETMETFQERCNQVMQALKAWKGMAYNFRTIDWTKQTGNSSDGIQHRADFVIHPEKRGDRMKIIKAVNAIQSVKFN